jgi:hypothetical protein
MTGTETRLNIGDILQTFDDKHTNKSSLNLAFQSLAKRSRFSEIFFHELEKRLIDYKLPLERGGIEFTDAGNLYPNRTYYEAYIYAYVQNMHAALDSLPFIVFMMLGPMTYHEKGMKKQVTSRACAWSENFLSAVEETFPSEKKISTLLRQFASNQNFSVLTGMVNRSKHQSLIRILNDGEILLFDEVEYTIKPKTKVRKMRGLKVRDFLRDTNNGLFPALFEIIRELDETRKRLP